jgi:NAD(P)-dependent dehydrogenase (short-subunit alcohol dehydrogenase family)
MINQQFSSQAASPLLLITSKAGAAKHCKVVRSYKSCFQEKKFLKTIPLKSQSFILILQNMTPTIVLISGANRGLGKGLLELYLARPNHIVIAANRDPSNTSSLSLKDLPAGEGSKLIVVKVDAAVESDPAAAVKELEAQGINHIDIVIANAGICTVLPKVSELKTKDMQAHFVTNVFGVVQLYQATLPLLLKAKEPKWATMGSTAGWVEVSVMIHAPEAKYSY